MFHHNLHNPAVCSSTFNAIYKILLVGTDVQILNNRVQSWNGGSFHHCCLFQAAYASLWQKTESNNNNNLFIINSLNTHKQK